MKFFLSFLTLKNKTAGRQADIRQKKEIAKNWSVNQKSLNGWSNKTFEHIRNIKNISGSKRIQTTWGETLKKSRLDFWKSNGVITS